VAWAYTGTPDGKKLAGQVLASYKHVHWLQGSEHGDIHYCAKAIAGFSEGVTPPAGCPAKATVSWVETLSNGINKSAVGTVVAPGKPTITFVANNAGTFTKAKGNSCWVKKAKDGSFVGYPPFSFSGDEFMTVGHHIGPNVLLNGSARSGLPTHETDTVNSHTHQIVAEDIQIHVMHPTFVLHLITSYHQVLKAPTVPATTPLC
jgi:hypothetical protein